MEFPAIGVIHFQQNGDYTMIWNWRTLQQGTDLLDPTKAPKEIDVVIERDFDIATKKPSRQGTTMPGIYQLEDDTFTACYGRDFEVRPTRFSSDNDGCLFVWRRTPQRAFARLVQFADAEPNSPAQAPVSANAGLPSAGSPDFPSELITAELRAVCLQIRNEEPRLCTSLDNGASERVPSVVRLSPRTRSLLEQHPGLERLFPDWWTRSVR